MMFTRGSLLAAAAVVAGGLLTGAPAASAQTEVGCVPAMSGPELVELPGGTRAVRASMTMAKCASNAQPTDVRICLATASGRSECRRLSGWNNVSVMIPTQPGPFTATGEVCWAEPVDSFIPTCRPAGPVSASF
jgi:hypothetical protein